HAEDAVRQPRDRPREAQGSEQLAVRAAGQPSHQRRIDNRRGTSRMNASMIRNRYVGDSVATASPARLVTMLYDRLVRDLSTAEAALAVSDLAAANTALVHAQDVVWELSAGLDPTRWSGGPALAALYQFVRSELVTANVKKDAARVVS